MWIKINVLKDKIFYIIYNIIILIISFVLDKFFEMLMFICFFELIQNCFLKRFHSDTIIENPIKAIKYCKLITIGVEIFYLIICESSKNSIYSNLFIIFLIAFINSLLQFYLERAIIKVSNLSNLEYLTTICKEANLSDLATRRMIMRYVEKKTIKEIANIEFVDEESIKMSIKRSKKKLNIK